MWNGRKVGVSTHFGRFGYISSVGDVLAGNLVGDAHSLFGGHLVCAARGVLLRVLLGVHCRTGGPAVIILIVLEGGKNTVLIEENTLFFMKLNI